jgi:hypothetical protein
MGQKKFKLVAEIRTINPDSTEQILNELVGTEAIVKTDGGFKVKTKMEGESARELNRILLSALRRAEKKTTLRAEWTHGDSTERFFDYVSKGIREA